jgi:hypothetical protein
MVQFFKSKKKTHINYIGYLKEKRNVKAILINISAKELCKCPISACKNRADL